MKTPLLVPSFSSKGLGRQEQLTDAAQASAEFLDEIVLISAYDLHYKHINWDPVSRAPALTIVDSGGYEISEDHDLAEVYRFTAAPSKWDERMHSDSLDAWPEALPALFVNFDSPKLRRPIQAQAEAARNLFSRFGKQMHGFLVKPETETETTLRDSLKSIHSDPSLLQGFQLIGVTEKELGRSVLARMEAVARLRLTLDEAGISTPIQIFGSLDPLLSCLYFIAGAEIFDGLSWLRYAFRDGLAMHKYEFGNSEFGIDARDSRIESSVLASNLYYLKDLQLTMRAHLLDGDFNKFKFNADFIEKGMDALKTKIERLK